MIENSSVVVNTAGSIIRKPGFMVQIHVDRDLKLIEDDTLEKVEDIKNRYKALEGTWIVAKVRNIIMPGTIDKPKKKYKKK